MALMVLVAEEAEAIMALLLQVEEKEDQAS
jgi:hypothetical protein